jgi:hypothetical protein
MSFFFFNRKQAKFLFILACITSLVVSKAYITSAAPLWFENGVYAEYRFDTSSIDFLNGTFLSFGDEKANAVYRWECIDLEDVMAEINVSIIFEKEDWDLKFSTMLNVNIENREVFLSNGTYVGKTSLWLPASPKLDDIVILGGTPSTDILGRVTSISEGSMLTPKGFQLYFDVGGKGIKDGIGVDPAGSWDLDTGVAIYPLLEGETTLLIFDITDPGDGTEFYATNIDLGPKEWWPEFGNAIWNAMPIWIIFSIIIVVYFRRRRKRRQLI